MKHLLRHTMFGLCLATLIHCASPAALSTEETAATDHGNDTASAATNVLTFADGALFAFDPTINTALDAPTNARAIGAYATDQLAGCASVTVLDATVSIMVNGPSCTLPNGTTASGTVTATVSKMGTTVRVAIAFTNAMIDGRTVSGSVDMVTDNGSVFTASGTVTSGANSLTFNNVQVTGSAGSFVTDGTVTAVKDGVTSNVVLSQVLYRAGDCYPSGGTARVTRNMVTSTITFTAATANSGTVTVMTGRITTSKQLPAYGACPGGRTVSDGGTRRDASVGRDR
jgi:hypothetical protein